MSIPSDTKVVTPTQDSTRLLAAQLALVYGQSRLAILISPLMAALAAYALWPATRHDVLLVWVVAIAACAVVRNALSKRYHATAPEARDERYWERRFVVTLAVTAAAWGVGGWLVMLHVAHADQALLYFFLITTAAGALVSYGAHAPSAAISVALMLVPATLYMLFSGDRFRASMGIAALFFAVVATRGIRLVSNAFGRSVVLADELDHLSRTDQLSGLNNRRAFTEFGEKALAGASRSGATCALIILDVDHFKLFNDRLGHAAGDTVIRALGKLLSSAVRAGEFAARIGGEEFAVILPNVTLEQAQAFANRILSVTRALRPVFDGEEIVVTVSIGVATSAGAGSDLEGLLANADAALYQAKHGGRDRVVVQDCVEDGH